MKSKIWRVTSKEIGALEPFKSEYDMEAFLMNNPALIGCWDPNDEMRPPYLRRLRQQVPTRRREAGGRIDLVGLVAGDDQLLLKIFELKVGAIKRESVNQLADYLHEWSAKGGAQQTARTWLLEFGLSQSVIDQLVAQPHGVLVGSSFDAEAIVEASRQHLEGIRLARFRSEAESEHFVVIEDQIGENVASTRRSWQELGIQPLDRLFMEVDDGQDGKVKKGRQKMFARPDPASCDRSVKRLVFEGESVKFLRKRANRIIGQGDARVSEALRGLKDSPSQPIALTTATALVFFASAGKRKSFSTPRSWWVLERTGQRIAEIESRLEQS